MVQIETKKAVDKMEEIAAVDDVDALFVGPKDLAASMGFFALDHQKGLEVQHAIAQILDVGKELGNILLPTRNQVR
jgi:4-hydroxy-2-oxoheptanedioate aldolase